MNRYQRALFRAAAMNLQQRAENACQYVKVGNGPADSIQEQKGAAYAFQVSADYLIGLLEGHEKAPKLCRCKTPDVIGDGETIPNGLTLAHCKRCKGVI